MGTRDKSARVGLARALAAALMALPLAACVQVQPQRADSPAAYSEPRILLMPPDVLVLEVSAAGLPLPKVDWTRVAEKELIAAAEARLSRHGATLVRYRPVDDVVPYAQAHLPAIKLHETVLDTILTFRYRNAAAGTGRDVMRLTTKGEYLAWTLGETVRPLQEDYDADYALFLLYRQATSTGGRALLNAASFVLFGMIAPTSQAVGLASLVDLHSGAVVWTNVLQGRTLDVSTPDDLRQKGRELLSGLPL